jgi:ADP-heptose:LPS heptosyltransferase
MRILIYSMGEILGDGAWKLPLMAGLRDAAGPDAHIAWAAASPAGTVYDGPLKPFAGPLLSETLHGPGAGAESRDLLGASRPFGGAKFDVVIDTQTRIGPALVARRALAPGGRFISAAARFVLSSARPASERPEAVFDQLRQLFELGLDREITPRSPDLTDPESEAAAAHLLPAGPTYVGLVPGAGGADRRWPLNHWIALANSLTRDGYVPVVFLGPEERGWETRFHDLAPAALTPEQDFNPQGLRGPRLVFALARRLTAAAANDCGGGHLLGLAGSPLLTLFRDARLAAKFPTRSPRPARLIAAEHGADGMASLSVSTVRAALNGILQGL